TRKDEVVRRFRKEVLGGRLLDRRQAERWISRRKVKPGGPADLRRLDTLCRDLADVYAWTSVEAEGFVLTGSVVPLVRPLAVQMAYRIIPALTRLVLTVDPLVPPSEVAAFYRFIRRFVLSRRTRRISAKHAELAAFVALRPRAEQWRETMRRWNATHRQSDQYDHVSNFRRDGGRAKKRLLSPPELAPRRHSPDRSQREP